MTQNAQPIAGGAATSSSISPSRRAFSRPRLLKAVDDVSFTIRRGETLGLVGESGCGKTTVGRTILHLYKPTGGRNHLRRQEIARRRARMHEYRRRAQMVFPGSVFLAEPAHDRRRHRRPSRLTCISCARPSRSARERVQELLETRRHLRRAAPPATPHEFSGGQRQRIGIARALASQPGVHRLRRAGLRAGRVHSGAGHQHARRPAGKAGADAICSSPTICRSSSTSPTASR